MINVPLAANRSFRLSNAFSTLRPLSHTMDVFLETILKPSALWLEHRQITCMKDSRQNITWQGLGKVSYGINGRGEETVGSRASIKVHRCTAAACCRLESHPLVHLKNARILGSEISPASRSSRPGGAALTSCQQALR